MIVLIHMIILCPAWAPPGEKRKKYGRALGLGADDRTLSDEDALDAFLEGKGVSYFHCDVFIIMLLNTDVSL